MWGIYGVPPAELAAWPDAATQLSPHIPGSAALEAAAEGSLAGLTMVAPANTFERRHEVGLALRALAAGAPLTVLAAKNKGGARLAAELTAFGCDVIEQARRHFRICSARRPADIRDLERALEDGAPRRIEALGLWSQPGVFSWDRIDPGSRLLAEQLPALAGRGADIGCGIGYLARSVLASPKVEHLILIDLDRRALAMAQRNVERERTRFVWADVAREGTGEGTGERTGLSGLDFVVMNPPFHAGGREDRSLGQGFIRRAADSLRPGGTLWLTANRHLPYEAPLRSLFRAVALRGEGLGFKVYLATK